MGRLVVFDQVSLDGYFAGPGGDIGWAHKDRGDAEWNGFVAENAGSGGVLVFGRITYELMASYWPTAQARENDPIVAERMNQLQKVVFSRTLEGASWSNTRLVKGDVATEIRALKKDAGRDLAILGSGSLVAQLAPQRLIDEYQIVVNPIVLGRGRTLFEGVGAPLGLRLTRTRTFANGNALLCYEHAG